MTKITAKAPANIAFIKYWGKRNEKLRLPANSSISMNLSAAYTITSVEFDKKYTSDSFYINGLKTGEIEFQRVSKQLNLIRNISKTNYFARVESRNNFPKASGIASSASGFAALTVAAAAAIGLNLPERELSILARLGSGSACRSIPDGLVEWEMGKNNDDSYAHSLFPVGYWSICDIIAVVGKNSKKVSSTEGHTIAESSPFYITRIAGMDKKVVEIKLALKNKDFTKFGEIIEAEALNMHAVMMTSTPPLYYWKPETLSVMTKITELRKTGLECYFTIDAGPNVHVICLSKDVDDLLEKLKEITAVRNMIVNNVSEGARIIK
jgi:diphosphomevalonate decarboxylase